MMLCIDPWMHATRYGRVDFAAGLLYFQQFVEWSSDVDWWTCLAVQSLEWIRSLHHESRNIQL